MMWLARHLIKNAGLIFRLKILAQITNKLTQKVSPLPASRSTWLDGRSALMPKIRKRGRTSQLSAVKNQITSHQPLRSFLLLQNLLYF